MRDVKTGENRTSASSETDRRHRIPVPWLATHDEIGLGSAVKKLTTAAGIEECVPCSARAAALDRLVVLAGRSSSAYSPLTRLLSLVSFVAGIVLLRGMYQRFRS